MALIPKKKKSESLKNDSSGFDAQWKVYNDRQEFSLNVDGKDISARVAVELRENDDLLVFDYKTLTYFLLPKFNEVEENVLYGVNGQKALHGIAVIVYDDQKKCDVYLNGKEIGDNTKPFILHGDLIIWIDPESDYFYVILSEGYKNNMLIIPDKMNFPNDLLLSLIHI